MSSSPYFTSTRWIATMRKIVRRLAISAVGLQPIDACLEALDIVAQRIYVGHKTIYLVATGHIAALFLEIFSNVGAHGRSCITAPFADASGKLSKLVRRSVPDDTG